MVCLSNLILLISFVINLFASLIKPLYCNEISYFDILGVKQTSSEDQIKKSYRKLAKLYHPDKNKNDPSAQTKFIEITKAYEVLSDQQKRLEYEDSLRFSNRINSRGDSRVNNWRQRRHNQFPSHLFEEDLFHNMENEEVFMFRAPNGQYYYSTQSQRGGNSFYKTSYSYSYSNNNSSNEPTFFSILYLIITVILFLISPFLPFILVIVFLLVLYIIYRCCMYPTTFISKKKKKEQINNNIMEITKEHLMIKGVILIVSLNMRAIDNCKKIKNKFYNDPIIFLSKDNNNNDFSIIAYTKFGQKWIGLNNEVYTPNDVELWIIKILNGDYNWNISSEIIPPITVE